MSDKQVDRAEWMVVGGAALSKGTQLQCSQKFQVFRKSWKSGVYMQSLDFKMFATKFNFLLLYNTAGQTKHGYGPNMTHRVCNLCLVILDNLRRELQLRGESCYFCNLVIFV